MLEGYNIILGSGSPRRRELLAGLGVNFSVMVREGVNESYPTGMSAFEVAQYIAEEKATAYSDLIDRNTLLITADTIVISRGKILGKPKNVFEAKQMLSELSGRTHYVTTGVCLTTMNNKKSFSVTTEVTFDTLSEAEINYYIDNYKPFDKAGSYGIQEWIGYIGVSGIKGSYFNVMGLPVQRIYKELKVL